ncbi:hypothetical protein LY76DRAFT_109537 [Colletotrichum caudatum]|nr:hypothetical protein LY76DRAFT_109537 [Colletotrichum caudatum]
MSKRPICTFPRSSRDRPRWPCVSTAALKAIPLAQVDHVYHGAIRIRGVCLRVASKGIRLASLSDWPRRSMQPYCHVCDVWLHFCAVTDSTLSHAIQWKWRRLALGGEIALIIVAAHVSAMCNMDGLERPECAAALVTPLSPPTEVKPEVAAIQAAGSP